MDSLVSERNMIYYYTRAFGQMVELPTILITREQGTYYSFVEHVLHLVRNHRVWFIYVSIFNSLQPNIIIFVQAYIRKEHTCGYKLGIWCYSGKYINNKYNKIETISYLSLLYKSLNWLKKSCIDKKTAYTKQETLMESRERYNLKEN